MSRFVPTIAVLAVAIVALTATSLPAESNLASRWTCHGGGISVTSVSAATARTVCEQGEKARALLASCGIHAHQPINVLVTRDLGEPAVHRAGDYDPRTGRVRLLTLAAYIQSTRSRFGVVGMSRVIHASVAAHEVAHGIFHERTAHLDLPETAHEYVAYVAQLATLPVDVRHAIITRSGLPRITNLFVFSFFLLRADPERFAIAALRHFNQPENGCSFLKDVIDGKVHFPPPGD